MPSMRQSTMQMLMLMNSFGLSGVQSDENAARGNVFLMVASSMIDRSSRTKPIFIATASIEATVRTLSNDERTTLAEDILGLFCRATELADTPVGFPNIWNARAHR